MGALEFDNLIGGLVSTHAHTHKRMSPLVRLGVKVLSLAVVLVWYNCDVSVTSCKKINCELSLTCSFRQVSVHEHPPLEL